MLSQRVISATGSGSATLAAPGASHRWRITKAHSAGAVVITSGAATLWDAAAGDFNFIPPLQGLPGESVVVTGAGKCNIAGYVE